MIDPQKYSSDFIILILQRGATAENMGEGSVLGRPHRVLLGDRKISDFFFFSFMASLVAYGGSQARGRRGTAAAGLRHSHGN